MIHFFKFHQDLLDPAPARDVYVKRPPGRGWPEECPPIRAANGFGFDLLANFDVTFVRDRRGRFRPERPITVDSDFEWQGSGPLQQEYAWGWEEGQTLPHPISDHVYARICNQMKVSSFLYLRTDPNEVLLMTDVPNRDDRRWRAMSAVIETDWYPASYPWHCVVELDRDAKRVTIEKGEPLCRLVPLRRDTYFARPMSPSAFEELFARGQHWLEAHGRPPAPPARPARGRRSRAKEAPAPDPRTLDITRTYSRQQARSSFIVVR